MPKAPKKTSKQKVSIKSKMFEVSTDWTLVPKGKTLTTFTDGIEVLINKNPNTEVVSPNEAIQLRPFFGKIELSKDAYYRSKNSKAVIYIGDTPYDTVGNFVSQEGSGGGGVTEVNGKTGVVVLDNTDVGAISDIKEATYDGYGNDITILQNNSFSRQKYEKAVASGAGLSIGATPTNVGTLIGITSGETPFYNFATKKFVPVNQDTTLRFKLSVNGTFSGGGGQGIEMTVAFGGVDQVFSITRADNAQTGFTILGWLEIDKGGAAVSNNLDISVFSVDDTFNINSYVFTIAQEG